MHQGDRWQTNIFYLNPVGNSLSGTDLNEADRQIDFYGLFATRPVSKHMSIDAYYLGLNNNREQFEYQTIGSRIFGETDSGHLYALEGAYQFGSNSPGYGNHNAAFMTAGMGHRLGRFCPQQTGEARLWLWYDWASGDDEIPAARGDNGFDALFPQSHWYLGFMDLFGRRNINDISIQFSTPILSSKLQFVLWYHYFFLDQKTTPYNTDMTAFNPDHAAADRHLGQELDILFNLRVNPRNELLLGYSFFKSGKYYQLTPGSPSDADGQFLYLVPDSVLIRFWTPYAAKHGSEVRAAQKKTVRLLPDADQSIDCVGIKRIICKTQTGPVPRFTDRTKIIDRYNRVFVEYVTVPTDDINRTCHGWQVQIFTNDRWHLRCMMSPTITGGTLVPHHHMAR